MKNKTIMIMPGGNFQVPLVSKAKSLGIVTVVTDANENAACKEHADVFEVASVLDTEKNLEIARRYNVNAVLTDQFDTAVKTVAYINEKLGLRSIGINIAELFTNKFKMREFCRDNGFSCPEFKLCGTLEDAVSFADNFGYPFIIKPIDNQSSKGVLLIHNKDELEESFDVVKNFSSNKDAVLAEEFLDGAEFTVDSIKTSDSAHTLAISQKTMFTESRNVAQSLIFTYENERYDYNRLRKENEKLITAMGLPFGIAHAEYRYVNGDFYLLEIAARGGGTELSSLIVPEMSGVDNYEILITESMGTPCALSKPVKDTGKAMILEFFDFKPGRIKTINGVERIKSLPYVRKIKLDLAEGSVIKTASNDTDRIGYFIISSGNVADLLNKREELLNMLELEYESV